MEPRWKSGPEGAVGVVCPAPEVARDPDRQRPPCSQQRARHLAGGER